MLYMTWISSGEKKALYTPGQRTEAEIDGEVVVIRTSGRAGEYKKLQFTADEAETLTTEKLP